MQNQLQNLIAKIGIENIRFLIPMRPVKRVLSIAYTSTNDEAQKVLAKIDETRYKIEDGYKITLVAENQEVYGNRHYYHYYQTYLLTLIKNGHIRVLIELPFNNEEIDINLNLDDLNIPDYIDNKT